MVQSGECAPLTQATLYHRGSSRYLSRLSHELLPQRAVMLEAAQPPIAYPLHSHRSSSILSAVQPELLLGSSDYTKAVDMWAIGTIMGELTDGNPLFPGDTEIDQLYIIQQCLGPLTSSQMESFLRNPRFAGLRFPEMRRSQTVHQKYGERLGKVALHFMRALLYMDPGKRLTARECLEHPWFAGLKEVRRPPAAVAYHAVMGQALRWAITTAHDCRSRFRPTDCHAFHLPLCLCAALRVSPATPSVSAPVSVSVSASAGVRAHRPAGLPAQQQRPGLVPRRRAAACSSQSDAS